MAILDVIHSDMISIQADRSIFTNMSLVPYFEGDLTTIKKSEIWSSLVYVPE